MRKCLQIIVSGIVLCFALSAYATENPEETLQSESLLNIIRDMNRRYNVHFTYDREIVEKVKIKKHYNPESYQDVNEALSAVLRETNLKFQVLDKKYVVIYRDDQKGMESLQRMVRVLQEIIDQKEAASLQNQLSEQKSDHPKIENLSVPGSRIDRAVKGKITDEKGEGLPGVNVVLKGTQFGTVTNVNGEYEISVPNDEAVLIFSFVGYVSQEMLIGGRTSLDILLKTDEKALEEVVVIGYGTQKQREVTGSISTLEAGKLEDQPVGQFAQKLHGRMPGVQINQASGTPGGGMAIRIRGASSINAGNSPLYVVDGFPSWGI